MQQRTGYHVYVVTVRKLSGSDPFAFADNVIESWYPNSADGDNKGVLVLAKQSKDGALVGGPSFQERVGDDLVDSIVSDQIPYLAGQEKYNEATTSTIERISAKLQGQEVPDSPSARTRKTKGASSFKSREETENKRGLYTKVVVGLLVLSFVAPMLQVRRPKDESSFTLVDTASMHFICCFGCMPCAVPRICAVVNCVPITILFVSFLSCFPMHT